MTLQEFITRWNGKRADYDGYYDDQCVDLYDFYLRDVVGAPVILVGGAADIWDKYPVSYFDKIPNSPTNFPTPGSVIIWGRTYGPYGHVAIVVEADVNSFKALSQNDPVGTAVALKNYDYYGVLGWLTPKKDVISSTPSMDRRGYWFDLINKVVWNLPREQITDDMVKGWVADYPTQRARSGKWDLLCQKIGITGDTNAVTPEQIIETIKLSVPPTDCQKQISEGIAKFKEKVIALINSLS